MKYDRNKVRNKLKKMKEKENSGGQFVDENKWKPETPDGKNVKKIGYKLRILPYGEEVPYVPFFLHKMQTKDGRWWYIECPSSINKECPICEYSHSLFATGDEVDKAKGKKFYRKKQWAVNVLVKKDARDDGDNEGKVFMYVVGPSIYEKFDSALFPDESLDEKEIFFIDPDEGFDFNLQVRLKDKYPNYETSKFADEATPIAGSEKEIDKILEAAFDLDAEFLSPTKYKSYEELEKMFNERVLGKSSKPSKSSEVVEDDDVPFDTEDDDSKVEEASSEENSALTDSVDSVDTDDDDDILQSLIDDED